MSKDKKEKEKAKEADKEIKKAAETAETAEETTETATEDAKKENTEKAAEKDAEVIGGEQKEDNVIGKKDKEIAELKEQLLRHMAEYDNYRKRTAKERMELTPDITAKILTQFLPVMDNIERAIKADCTDENYKKGIELIYDSFLETMKNIGVEEIESENADFNPSFHQAVQQVESDELESGKIASTFQKGYKIGDKVIRFAMVAVVK